MNRLKQFQDHLERCQAERERLIAAGKWPWPDSPKSENVVESGEDDQPLSEASLKALEQLGLALKAVYLRLNKEGYRIKDGKIIKLNE